MEPPIQAEMTVPERNEMEALMAHYTPGSTAHFTFEHAYRMGFIAGKLSTLNHIVNHSPLYNGELKFAGFEDSPASDSKERVAPAGKKGDSITMHRKRENKDRNR